MRILCFLLLPLFSIKSGVAIFDRPASYKSPLVGAVRVLIATEAKLLPAHTWSFVLPRLGPLLILAFVVLPSPRQPRLQLDFWAHVAQDPQILPGVGSA